MSHLTEEQLKELYLQLLEEKLDLEKHFATNDNFGLSNSFTDSTGELSMYDNHPGDIATEIYEREKDISLNEHAEFHLQQVDEALAHMESGDYGICVFCKKPIPFERLQAIPTTLYCLEHVPDPNQSFRRPVEEQVLFPPFGRTSFDERNDETEFDGEDAWQIVESWGTSNTPAFAEDSNVENYNEMYIEADEHEGYVESFESFVATDLYGEHVTIVRSKAYRDYMHNGEGDPLLEPENLSPSYDEQL
ncbi:transcriptional regulator, TraR/DksA family [Paenibacillus sp. yr247]|uniref:TraR/DksA C4-type zinc finger protein n=1 Tax=Paenibacillus sp. yr247 TaxID=1761880 RepID=UPI00088D7509|nr:TraR/DksA C4-type zinc finger protein [Paenibacillus sp. yr247]SDM91168.1 transcriptional regulator, TraR/DksA family [Paenibacillus sp. yr247]